MPEKLYWIDCLVLFVLENDMNVLFVMDPLEKINVSGDSTYMLMVEACLREWRVAFCTPTDLFIEAGKTFAKITWVDVDNIAPFFHVSGKETLCLGTFQVVWLRKDPPFNMDYIFSTYLLELVPPTTLVLNNPSSVRSANEKIFALNWPQFCPETLMTNRIEHAREWAKKQPGKVVIKPWDGNGGRGVLVSSYDDPNFRSMVEVLTDEERRYIIVQQYIPEIVKGDKRIILVDGEAIGWMNRIPQPGDHRGNMHVGASVSQMDLSENDRRICKKIGPTLQRLGLLFVGIDIIGDYLTEINVTSPTGIQEINPMMGIQIEKIITDSVIKKVQGKTK